MRQATEPIRSGERPIATGSAYGALFPRADHRDRTLVRNGDVGDTLDLMQRVVWTYRDDTRRLAPMLQQARLEDTCRAVWEFIYRHIQYRLDKKGLEQLRRPARTWSERRQGGGLRLYEHFCKLRAAQPGHPPIRSASRAMPSPTGSTCTSSCPSRGAGTIP